MISCFQNFVGTSTPVLLLSFTKFAAEGDSEAFVEGGSVFASSSQALLSASLAMLPNFYTHSFRLSRNIFTPCYSLLLFSAILHLFLSLFPCHNIILTTISSELLIHIIKSPLAYHFHPVYIFSVCYFISLLGVFTQKLYRKEQHFPSSVHTYF